MSQIKGVNLRLYHNPAPPVIKQRLQEIVDMGANAVAIVPTHYVYLKPGTPDVAPPLAAWGLPQLIYPDIGQDEQHPYGNTPSMDTVSYTCWTAKELGLDVWLKPHLDSYYGAWRGWIRVPPGDPTKPVHSYQQRDDFIAAYGAELLQRYATLSVKAQAGLVIGTELVQITKDHGAAYWIGQAKLAQTWDPSGPLTYAANWGQPGDGEVYLLEDLWKSKDANMRFIGVDGYWPIANVDGAQASWLGIGKDLAALAGRTGKQALFTEIGYQNDSNAGAQPWGVDCATAQPDDARQLELAQAFMEQVVAQPWCGGFFWWEAPRLRVTNEQDACEAKGVSHEVRPGSELAKVLFG